MKAQPFKGHYVKVPSEFAFSFLFKCTLGRFCFLGEKIKVNKKTFY